MIYLMSDVHGCSSLFFEMLEHISFGISDRMYILGDLVGKGPDSLGLLRCVMEDGRIRLLRGNHEQRLLQALGVDLEAGISREILEEWEREDGREVLRQLSEISAGERGRILEFLKNTPLYEQNIWSGHDWLLVHGAPVPGMGYGVLENRFRSIEPNGEEPSGEENAEWKEEMGGSRSIGPGREERLPGEKNSEWKEEGEDRDEKRSGIGKSDREARKDMPPRITVVGHTPTFKYVKQYAGRIIVGKERIFLDCGAGWGCGLGCLRLEDGKEFYCRES